MLANHLEYNCIIKLSSFFNSFQGESENMLDKSISIIVLLLFTSLLAITSSYLSTHADLPVFTEGLKRSKFKGKRCHCSWRKPLDNMAPVKFESGHMYMVDANPFGDGGYGKVYHAVRLASRKWRPYKLDKCVVIKVARLDGAPKDSDSESLTTFRKKRRDNIEKEATVLDKLWHSKKSRDNGTPKHIIDFLEKEHFTKKEKIPVSEEENNQNSALVDNQTPVVANNQTPMALRTREVTTNNSALVLEMGLTTLRTYWRAKVAVYKRYGYQLISELVILKLLRQIGSGIKEINERGFIYMDLKPSNIVLTKEPEIELLLADNVDQVELKLIDFGAAQEYKAYERFIPKKHPTIMDVDKPVFTPYYAAPEVVFKEVSPMSDSFSFGRIALKLIASVPYFEDYIKENGVYGKHAKASENFKAFDHFLKSVISGRKSARRDVEFIELLKTAYPHIFDIIMKTQLEDQAKRVNSEEILQQIDDAIKSVKGHRYSLLDVPKLSPKMPLSATEEERYKANRRTHDREASTSKGSKLADLFDDSQQRKAEHMTPLREHEHEGPSTTKSKHISWADELYKPSPAEAWNASPLAKSDRNAAASAADAAEFASDDDDEIKPRERKSLASLMGFKH